jgi:predicted nucleic-acid-binding Zn-ribbon protein
MNLWIKEANDKVAKKKLLGGWKEFRDCPKCIDPDYDNMANNRSMRSGGSTRSKKSAMSVKSNSFWKGGHKTDCFGALPQRPDGIQEARGGWKMLHEGCPRCIEAKYEEEAVISVGLDSCNDVLSSIYLFPPRHL